MFGKMGEKVKGAGKVIMAILKGTLVAGLLLAVVAFLESPYWTKTKAFIVDTIVPAIEKFWGYLKMLSPIFEKYFVDTWNNIKELFSGLGKSFDLFAKGEWWEGIKTLVSSIGTFLGDQVDAILTAVTKEIGPHAKPDKIQFSSALPKTRSGKIMRRILRKIAEGDFDNMGDISTLADPSVVDSLIKGAN